MKNIRLKNYYIKRLMCFEINTIPRKKLKKK